MSWQNGNQWRARVVYADGFTLIELLVVLTIIAAVVSMAMPLINIANKHSRITATKTVLSKLDVSLRMFRSDVGGYPYQLTYANIANGETPTNQLFWHVGTRMSAQQLKHVQDDAQLAASRYAAAGVAPNDFAFIHEANTTRGIDSVMKAAMLNRMAAERAQLAILCGNVEITGPMPTSHVNPGSTTVDIIPRVLPTGRLVPAGSLSSTAPYGWAEDYLEGALDRRYVNGKTVLDSWGSPVMYVCSVIEGVYSAPVLFPPVTRFSSRDWGMATRGRISLAAVDALTGQATLLDLTALTHTDRRLTAAPRYESEFEVWSMGPDGRADWMRDGSSHVSHQICNRDNLSSLPYDKGIVP